MFFNRFRFKHLLDMHPEESGTHSQHSQNGSYAIAVPSVEEIVENIPLKGNSEDDLNSVAFHAAVSELFSIALGKVGFVCATVVLLSGYYGHLKTSHFWIVADLLVIKAARLLTSQHELHLRTKVVQSDSYWRSRSLGTERYFGCEIEECKIRGEYLPQPRRTKGINLTAILHVMQIMAAVLCVSLSVAGIIMVKDYGLEVGNQSVPVLVIFYLVVLFESLIFISGRACWQRRKHFSNATRVKFGLQKEHTYFFNQYAYYVYCKCMGSSIFEGTHFSLLDFTIMKISSDMNKEKHSSAVIMERILRNKHSLKVVKVFPVLLQIVSWDNCRVILPPENVCEARHVAAEILFRAVKWCPTSCCTLASIPGAFEAIFTLFSAHTCEKHGGSNKELPLQGLRILNDMAKNPKNILNIGFVHNLMSRLSEYLICSGENSGEWSAKKKKALQLLNKLAQTEHRKQIPNYGVENLCSMVRKEADFSLKKLAICILISLAMDGNVRDEIGSIGYIIPTLGNLFLVKTTESMSGCENGKSVKNQHKVRQYAGDALYLLSHKEPKNCRRMLGNMPGYENEKNLIKFINLLSEDDIEIRMRSAKILTNFLKHTESKWHRADLTLALEKSLKMMDTTSETDDLIREDQQEAALHLLTCLVPHLEQEEHQKVFNGTKLLELISYNERPKGVPCLRRHAVALAVTLMQENVNLRYGMKGMREMLKNLIKTISGSENVCIELVQEKRGVRRIIWEDRSGESIEELITRGLNFLKP